MYKYNILLYYTIYISNEFMTIRKCQTGYTDNRSIPFVQLFIENISILPACHFLNNIIWCQKYIFYTSRLLFIFFI